MGFFYRIQKLALPIEKISTPLFVERLCDDTGLRLCASVRADACRPVVGIGHEERGKRPASPDKPAAPTTFQHMARNTDACSLADTEILQVEHAVAARCTLTRGPTQLGKAIKI